MICPKDSRKERILSLDKANRASRGVFFPLCKSNGSSLVTRMAQSLHFSHVTCEWPKCSVTRMARILRLGHSKAYYFSEIRIQGHFGNNENQGAFWKTIEYPLVKCAFFFVFFFFFAAVIVVVFCQETLMFLKFSLSREP